MQGRVAWTQSGSAISSSGKLIHSLHRPPARENLNNTGVRPCTVDPFYSNPLNRTMSFDVTERETGVIL